MTNREYLSRIKKGAIQGWAKYKVLPSLTGAQAIIESGWGTSRLASPPYNNQFGIKASDDWRGKVVNFPTREFVNGSYITVNANFRAYDNLNDSVEDHAAFFSNTEWRRNNYRAVIGEQDYKRACQAVKDAGYATDPLYARKLIDIIEENKLYEWDREAFASKSSSESSESQVPTVTTAPRKIKSKIVGGELTEAGKVFGQSLEITVIGDGSVTGIEPILRKSIPRSNFDVREGRRISQGSTPESAIHTLRQLKSGKLLKELVVVIVGSQHTLNLEDLMTFSELCDERRILFVETASIVSHKQHVNAELRNLASRQSNAYVLKWSELVGGMHHEFYESNRVNLTTTGLSALSDSIVQGLYEMLAGDFSSTSAKSAQVSYEGIEGFTLKEDGTLRYATINEAKQVIWNEIQTEFRGLATDGYTSQIYNVAANNKWNPQNGQLEAEWLEGEFVNNDLKGLDLLFAACRDMMQRSEPEATYRVSLSYLPEGIAIGSEGTIIDTASNPPKYIKARVSEITTSQCNPEQNEIVITNVTEVAPYSKSTVKLIQQELIHQREEMLQEWRQGEPLRVQIVGSGANVFSNTDEVMLLQTKVFRGTEDITGMFDDFRWERNSLNLTADIAYNRILSQAGYGAVLSIKSVDVEGDSSQFICRVYKEGELVGHDTITCIVPIRIQGKSAYELWLEEGNRGTVQQFLQALRGRDGQDGRHGENGLPGPKGADGRTQYTHIAYANGTQGEDFSTTDSENRSYLGTYVDFNQVDSLNYNDYHWQKIKGDKGDQGKGITIVTTDYRYDQREIDTYSRLGYRGTWKVTSDTSSVEAGDTIYLTMFNRTLNRDCSVLCEVMAKPSAHWLDLKSYTLLEKGADGENGVPGPKGADGRTPYFHTAYANSANGQEGFSTTDSNGKLYLGTLTDFTPEDSMNPSDYRWQRIKGDRGKSIKIVTTGYRYPQNEIDAYSRLGYRGVWIVNSDISSVEVGDTIYLTMFNRTLSRDCSILCEVMGKPSANELDLKSYSLFEKGADGSPGLDASGENILRDTFDFGSLQILASSGVTVTTYTDTDGSKIARIRSSGQSRDVWSGFGLQFYADRLMTGSKLSYRIPYRVLSDVPVDEPIVVEIKQHSSPVLLGGRIRLPIPDHNNWNVHTGTLTLTGNLTDLTNSFYCFLTRNGCVEFKLPYLGYGTIIPEDYRGNSRDALKAFDNFLTRSETEEYIRNLQGEIQKTKQEQEALASSQQVSEFMNALYAYRQALATDKQKSEKALSEALSAVASVNSELGAMAQRWQFLDIYMKATNSGFIIGNETKGTYLRMVDDRIGFYNNGKEIAYISGNLLHITQAVFVEQIQVAEWQIAADETDNEILVFRHVGRGLT